MSTVYRKTGDTEDPIPYTIMDGGAARDLTDASGVTVTIEAPDGTLAVDAAAATIQTATDGTVSYKPASGDLAQEGEHKVEWTVSWSDGDTSHHPAKGYQILDVDSTL